MNTTQTSYTSPLPHLHAWTPTQISNRTFPVTGGRLHGTEVALGDSYGTGVITGLDFYTGFAGCPARYYVHTTTGDFIINA